MDKFLRIVIDRPVFVIMVEVFLMVLGVIGFYKLNVDLFPDIDPPVITVNIRYPGAGPKEIETLIAKPVEEEISQISGIDTMESISQEGVAFIVVSFKLERNALEALIDVRDRVGRVKSKLPAESEEPLVSRLDFEDRPIFRLALIDKYQKYDAADLRLIADNQIKNLLQQIDGVGQIDLFGGREREIQIAIDRKKMMLWKLTPLDISQALNRSNINIPAGKVFEEPVRRSLRVVGEYPTLDEIGNTKVRSIEGGKVIQISDLATVLDTTKEPNSLANLNGNPVIFIEIKKQSGKNTVKIAQQVKKQLAQIENRLKNGLGLQIVFDGARRIQLNVNDVLETMVIATTLTILVILFFLKSVQSTFITGLAIPTSIIATFFALHQFGFTINVMTLLGLTLSVGLIVDDAIVVRENIWHKIEQGMAPKDAAFFGTKEVFTAVIATSLTLLATFIPVAFIPGIVGRFFAAFALTVVMTIIFSTYDALTVAPMLSAYLITKKTKKTGGFNPIQALFAKIGDWEDFISKFYNATLAIALRRPKTVLLISLGIFIVSLSLFKYVGFTFLPTSESGEVEIKFELSNGSTITQTTEIARQVEAIIWRSPAVEMVAASLGGESGDSHRGSIFIKLKPEGNRDISTAQFKKLLRNSLASTGKLNHIILNVGNPGQGGGARKQMSLIIKGNDYDTLTRLSDKIMATLNAKVTGLADLETNMRPGIPELQFKVRQKRMAAFDLDTAKVGQALRAYFGGDVTTKFREADEEYDIRVLLQESDRSYFDAFDDITIPNQRGEPIPLLALVDLETGRSPTKISRIDRTRSIKIESNLQPGFPLSQAIVQIKKEVIPLLPDGYNMEFTGQAKNLKDLRFGFIFSILLGGLFIYMIMASLYDSIFTPFAILMTLPLTVIGVVLAMLLTGKLLDVYGIIGLILLLGLVTKNAILVIDYAVQLKAEGKETMEAIYIAATRRFRPILMTAISTIFGMSSIAFGWGELNQERSSMGVAAIGGLISSTFLSLIVIPCFYIYVDKFQQFVFRIKDRFWGPAA